MSHTTYLSPLAACIVVALFATPVMAQSIDVTADADARIGVPNPPPNGPGMKPLDFIKARAQQINQGTPRMPGNIPAEVRADAKIRLSASSSKERTASSTPFVRGLKALVMTHGGVIKNRFRLAIEHLNNLLGRIDSRLEKMAASGIDTSSVVTLHANAEIAVDKAEADAKAAADFAATADDATDRAAFKAQLETKLRTAHQSLKAAHQAVVKTVRALVQLARDNKPKADANASVDTSSEAHVDVQ